MKQLFTFLLLAFALTAHGQRFVKTFNTLDEAWAANLNDVHTNIFIASRSVANDGGGGMFWYEKNATTATNRGMVFGNKYSGRIFRVWDTEILPQWFGADDACAAHAEVEFQSALDFAARPTYGWQKYAGQDSGGGNNASFKVKPIGCFAFYDTIDLNNGVLIEGKPGSSSGDFGGHTIFQIWHGGIGVRINVLRTQSYQIGGIKHVVFSTLAHRYQANKKSINTVIDRFTFKVADADAPPVLDDITLRPANNTCFFYNPDGEYLGSARIKTVSSAAGLTTVNLDQSGTDAFTSINNAPGGALTTACKVVWPKRITDEVPGIVGVGGFNDPALAGVCAISVRNDSNATITGSPILEDIMCWGFHCAYRFGPAIVWSGAPYSDLRSTRHKFAGMAFPRPDNTTDIVFNGLTYVSGYYGLDFGQVLTPNGSVTVTATSPAVFTKIGHGFQPGTAIRFGAATMPSGLSVGSTYPGTQYYVQATGLTADTFQVSSSFSGGALIGVTTTGSGLYIAGSALDQPALNYGTYGIYNAPCLARYDSAIAEFSAYANVYVDRVISPHFKYLLLDGSLRHGIVIGNGYTQFTSPSSSYQSDWVNIDNLIVKPGLANSPYDTLHTNAVAVYFEKAADTTRFAGISINQFSAVRQAPGNRQFTHAFDLQPAAYNNRAKIGMVVENNGYVAWRNPTSGMTEVDAPNFTQAVDVDTGWYRPSWTQRDFAVSGIRTASLTSGNLLLERSAAGAVLTLKNTTSGTALATSVGTDTFSLDDVTSGRRFGTWVSTTTDVGPIIGSTANTLTGRGVQIAGEAMSGTDKSSGNFFFYSPRGTGAGTSGSFQFYTGDTGVSGVTQHVLSRKFYLPNQGGIRLEPMAADITTAGVGHLSYVSGSINNFRFFDRDSWQPLSPNSAEQSIASAGSMQLALSTSEKIFITGTTTINGFGSAQAGVRRFLRFEGALTITRNATSLEVPGAASIVTAAGDTAEAHSAGSGNWRIVSYQRASGAALVSSGGVSDGDKGDITVTGSGATYTIDNSAVTYAKIQNVSAVSKLLGRNSTTTGPPEEITLGSGLTMTGTTLSSSGGSGVTDGDKGDITISGTGTVYTIDNGVVSLAKMANLATDTLIGRDTAGTGAPEALTVGGGVEFSGAGGIQRSALTGDVTASAGSGTTTIANSAVTYAKMQNASAASVLLGRGAGAGAGALQQITLGSGLSMAGTVLSASAAGVADGDYGDISITGGVWNIDPGAVTLADMADMNPTRALGRKTGSGVGPPEEVTISDQLDWTSGVTPAMGDVLYRGASSWYRLAPGTSGQFLQTQGPGASPQWGGGVTTTGSPTSGQAAEFSAAGTITGTTYTGTGSPVKGTAPTFASTVTIGTAGGTTGAALLKGTTSGTVTLTTAAAAGTHTIKLPTADGTANQVLKTDGAGQWGWTTAGSGSVATDAIFTAKGDLPVGTGSSTAQKLSVGKNQEFIVADSSATTGLKWVPSTFGVPFGRQAWGSRMIVANSFKEEGFTFAENSTTSGYTVSTASAPNFRTLNTAATINTDAYIQINASGDCPYYGKRIIASGVFGLTTTANVRAYLGLNSAGNAFGSDTAPNHSMMFRYSTSAGDTTWHAVCKDGATQNDVDTTVTADTSMHYFLIIYDYAASELRYYIDNVLKVTLVSNLPVSGNQGFGCFGVRTLTGSAIGVKYSHIYVLNDQL